MRSNQVEGGRASFEIDLRTGSNRFKGRSRSSPSPESSQVEKKNEFYPSRLFPKREVFEFRAKKFHERVLIHDTGPSPETRICRDARRPDRLRDSPSEDLQREERRES